VYAVVLQAAWAPAGAEAADPGRRRMLSLVPVGLGLGALAVLGVRLFPEWYGAVAAPPESGITGPSPELTPVKNFYVVSKNFSDPVVGAQGWTLSVQGLVSQPYRLAYADLQALPGTTEIVTLECISNDVGGGLMSTGRFTGVPLRDLVNKAAPKPNAAAIAFDASDGYVESMPLEMAMADPQILVAHMLDGEPLAPAHGFPARVLIPGRYGMKGPKWLTAIKLATSEPTGYWEGQGWNPNAPVQTTARIDVPAEGAIRQLGPIQIAGVAFTGTRGVQAVEVSTDGGRTWRPASVKPPLSPLSWVLWTADWTPASEGAYTLMARARDGSGDLQSGRVTPSYPSGASGYHTVHVNVARG
jgi:DMSO/TMAO reductase YedYZ molybdopterin-dependent catalytic subunit